jgi:hypothetical protein
VSFRRRTFPEVLDNLLTDITGGVAAEAHPFPPPGAANPPFRHQLQRPPAASIVSLYGSRDGQPKLFRKDTDYKLLADAQTVEWQKGAALPDAGTLVYINYYPKSALPVLTDIETGSVVRTMAETVALEMAAVYAEMESVYRSGFVDTANGTALDNVVSLLDIARITGGRSASEVEFHRASGTSGTIAIPAGTRVSTSDGKIDYETTGEVTMAAGQDTIRVVARDLDPKNGPLPAGSLVLLPVPIAGIATVANPAPTARLSSDETDDQLRTRAKNFLHGSERATLGAIRAALAEQAIAADVDEVADTPGFVEITPHVDALAPEAQQRLLSAIDAVRPAGVTVTLKAAVPPSRVNLKLRIQSKAGLVQQDLRAIQHTARQQIADYFSNLPAKSAGSLNKLIGLVQNVPGVEEVAILAATWNVNGVETSVLDTANGQLAIAGAATVLGDLQITDPALPVSLNVVVTFPAASAPPDQPSIQSAFNTMTAYLNNRNATPLPPSAPASLQQTRALSYGKLLRVLPLPTKPSATLADYDAASPQPALPTAAGIAPYKATFTFTAESGVANILAADADPAYTLAPFERLALGGVQVSKEGSGA